MQIILPGIKTNKQKTAEVLLFANFRMIHKSNENILKNTNIINLKDRSYFTLNMPVRRVVPFKHDSCLIEERLKKSK